MVDYNYALRITNYALLYLYATTLKAMEDAETGNNLYGPFDSASDVIKNL